MYFVLPSTLFWIRVAKHFHHLRSRWTFQNSVAIVGISKHCLPTQITPRMLVFFDVYPPWNANLLFFSAPKDTCQMERQVIMSTTTTNLWGKNTKHNGPVDRGSGPFETTNLQREKHRGAPNEDVCKTHLLISTSRDVWHLKHLHVGNARKRHVWIYH